MPARHPPPPAGMATFSRSAGVQLGTMPRRDVAYPPYRALPPPSPATGGEVMAH